MSLIKVIKCLALFVSAISLLSMQVAAAPVFVETQYGAGTTPYSVSSADFNGDTFLDLAVANVNSNDVSVLIGNGAGGFAVAVNYAAGIGPTSVTSADFNGDGNLDMAVVNQVSNNVSVLLGVGDGTFNAVVNYAAGTSPASVTSADFNGDTFLDLAVANANSNNISVLLGVGNGTFTLPAVNYAAGTFPTSVTSADFNGDTFLDLAVANVNSNDVSVLIGNGAGGFAVAVNYAAGIGPTSVTSADFNGDGNLDMAVVNQVSNNVSVLLGVGDGTFNAVVNYAAGTSPASVTSADFDGDTFFDLAVANRGSDNVSLLLGDGAGGFAVAVNYPAGTAPYSVISADFNGDTLPDMTVANSASNNVSVLLHQDTTAPTGTIIVDAGNVATNVMSVNLTLTCSDNVGCVQMQFSNDNIAWGALEVNGGSKAWTLRAGGDGIRTVYVRFKDAAGNLSTIVNDVITLDTFAPAAALITAPANNTLSNVTARPVISGTAEAGASVAVKDGAASLGLVTATGGNWSLASGGAVLIAGVHSFTATATDQAGNTGPVSAVTSYTVDLISPVIVLNGASSVTVNAGPAYSDAKATVTDNVDATTVALVGASSVNMAVAGTYTIIYTYTDAAGNAALPVTRTVIVIGTPLTSVITDGGCTLNPNSRSLDPIFPLMFALSIIYLGLCRRDSVLRRMLS